jgi:hypothetical protein
MDCPQIGFLQITKSVKYLLSLVRPERWQDIQDFSFAHAKSLRQGTPKNKRSRRSLSRPVARLPDPHRPPTQGYELSGVSGLPRKHEMKVVLGAALAERVDHLVPPSCPATQPSAGERARSSGRRISSKPGEKEIRSQCAG